MTKCLSCIYINVDWSCNKKLLRDTVFLFNLMSWTPPPTTTTTITQMMYNEADADLCCEKNPFLSFPLLQLYWEVWREQLCYAVLGAFPLTTQASMLGFPCCNVRLDARTNPGSSNGGNATFQSNNTEGCIFVIATHTNCSIYSVVSRIPINLNRLLGVYLFFYVNKFFCECT